MTQEKAAQLFKAVQKDEALKAKLKATNDAESFLKIAEQRGYKFTLVELQAELGKLSDEELAEIVNPGIAPRRHIVPR